MKKYLFLFLLAFSSVEAKEKPKIAVDAPCKIINFSVGGARNYAIDSIYWYALCENGDVYDVDIISESDHQKMVFEKVINGVIGNE